MFLTATKLSRREALALVQKHEGNNWNTLFARLIARARTCSDIIVEEAIGESETFYRLFAKWSGGAFHFCAVSVTEDTDYYDSFNQATEVLR